MAILREIAVNEYRTLHRHVRRDFPITERPPFRSMKNNLSKGTQRAMYMEQGEQILGYAIVTAPDGLGYALVNFLAVLPDQRGGGHGTELLRLLNEAYPDRVLVLEVEDPSAARNAQQRDTRERRIRFYRRAGFAIVPTQGYRLFTERMLVMMNRGAKPRDVRAILHALYRPTFSRKWLLRFVNVKNA